MPEAPVSINGYVRVEERAHGRRTWVAEFVTHRGPRTRKVLGDAWVRDTGRRTPHGGKVWRAADGTCPDGLLTPRAARAALEVLLSAEREQLCRRPGQHDIALGDLLDQWLMHLEVHGGRRGPLSPSTAVDYRSIVTALKELLGTDTPIASIDVAAVRELQDRLPLLPGIGRSTRSLGPSRRRQIMQRLRQALDFAVARGMLPDNPARFVDLPAPAPPHVDFNVLEPSRVEAVARAVQQLPDYDLPLTRGGQTHPHLLQVMQRRRALYADAVCFSAYTGLRVGELRALRWRDIDFSGEAVQVTRNNPSSAPAGAAERAPKSGRGRSVPLTPGALAALDRISRLGLPVGPEDIVFATEDGGPVDGGRLREALYRGFEAAGLEYLRTKPNPFRWHDLRHTFGTMAVRVFPLTDVQAYMGHADIQTTMRYVHHTPRVDAAAKLAAVFAQDLNPLGPGPPRSRRRPREPLFAHPAAPTPPPGHELQP